MRYKIPEEDLKILSKLNKSRSVFVDAEKALDEQMMRHVIVNVTKKLNIKNFNDFTGELKMNLDEGWIEIGLVTPGSKILVPKDFNGAIKLK